MFVTQSDEQLKKLDFVSIADLVGQWDVEGGKKEGENKQADKKNDDRHSTCRTQPSDDTRRLAARKTDLQNFCLLRGTTIVATVVSTIVPTIVTIVESAANWVFGERSSRFVVQRPRSTFTKATTMTTNRQSRRFKRLSPPRQDEVIAAKGESTAAS